MTENTTTTTTPTTPHSERITGPGAPPLPVELRMAIMRTSRRLRTEASGDAVSPGQFSVLAGIQHQSLTLRQLADREHIQAPSMTRIVNALEEMDLVTRREHPTDGRQVLVEITSDGLDVLAAARSRRTEWLAVRLAALPPKDQDVLHQAAQLLLEMSAK
jgi:DNA-binding MarR family transcriptional regulator